jgi:D-tyrosyl-tRNA(Tyr) deacylase
VIVVIQRVTRASVEVDGRPVAAIGPGVLLLVGLEKGDGEAVLGKAAEKIVHLRIHDDDAGKLNRSLLEAGGAVLAVSQFTLAGDLERGRRPSFDRAMPPEEARPLFDGFVDRLRALGAPVRAGVFGAKMAVALVNDGPVTLIGKW